ncbi:Peptidase family M48 domain containing protein [Rhypophila decipiens]
MASKLSRSWAPVARTAALQRSRIIIPVRAWPAHSARTISSPRAQSRTSSSPLRTFSSSSSSRAPPPPPPSLLRLVQYQRLPPKKIASKIQTRNYEFRPSQYDPDGSRLRDAKPLLTKSNLGRVARSPSTHIITLLAIAGAFIFYFSNLETVPVSGRTRFNVYSADSVRKMSDMQYKMLLYEFERNNIRILGDFDPRTQRVRRVMKKLIPFSGMGKDENWEIYVVDDPHTANAFVLPGGKVFVFSGILPLARNDSALAAVLGHEIAHNVAGHVGERMSGSIGTNILLYSGMLVAAGIGLGPLLMHYLGSKVLTVVLENPMSRKQESEADYIGLMIMAEACYDPREAVGFWERMEGAMHGHGHGGEEVPEWASTHPSNENRIKKIQEWLPKAMEKRDMSDCRTTTAFADLFRRALETGVLIVEE